MLKFWEIKLQPLLHALLIAPSNKTVVQFLRYGFVAAVAMVFDFGTYAYLALSLDIYPPLASALGFIIGITVMYLLSIRWVFSTRQRTRKAEITGFLTIGLVGMGLTSLFVWLIAVVLGQNEILAKAIAVVIVFFWNFGARKWLLFK